MSYFISPDSFVRSSSQNESLDDLYKWSAYYYQQKQNSIPFYVVDQKFKIHKVKIINGDGYDFMFIDVLTNEYLWLSYDFLGVVSEIDIGTTRPNINPKLFIHEKLEDLLKSLHSMI